MDALREHLKALGLHWLANVKDAVRLNQVKAGRYRLLLHGNPVIYFFLSFFLLVEASFAWTLPLVVEFHGRDRDAPCCF